MSFLLCERGENAHPWLQESQVEKFKSCQKMLDIFS